MATHFQIIAQLNHLLTLKMRKFICKMCECASAYMKRGKFLNRIFFNKTWFNSRICVTGRHTQCERGRREGGKPSRDDLVVWKIYNTQFLIRIRFIIVGMLLFRTYSFVYVFANVVETVTGKRVLFQRRTKTWIKLCSSDWQLRAFVFGVLVRTNKFVFFTLLGFSQSEFPKHIFFVFATFCTNYWISSHLPYINRIKSAIF